MVQGAKNLPAGLPLARPHVGIVPGRTHWLSTLSYEWEHSSCVDTHYQGWLSLSQDLLLLIYQPWPAEHSSDLYQYKKRKMIMMSNCLLMQPLVKETALLSKVGCEFSCPLSPCPFPGGGGRKTVSRQSWAWENRLCLFPQPAVPHVVREQPSASRR